MATPLPPATNTEMLSGSKSALTTIAPFLLPGGEDLEMHLLEEEEEEDD
jgi:hypothetical protein